MAAIGEQELADLLQAKCGFRLVEPQIYSVLPDVQIANVYDTPFGSIYDWLACNPLYNRLVWGYSVEIFARMAREALLSSNHGTVLDLGCGSLAFTAKTYLHYPERPVVLVDQSLKMLRIAKSRLLKRNGRVPDNLVFLHADARELPFRAGSFETIISENLLHCLDDTSKLLTRLQEVIAKDGRMYFTTLIKGNRFADHYLAALARGGKLVSRTLADHQAVFARLGMAARYEITGNMLSIYCGK